MQKMIWTPSESAGANSETPNHAFALPSPKQGPVQPSFKFLVNESLCREV
jgi:hypothetical protein